MGRHEKNPKPATTPETPEQKAAALDKSFEDSQARAAARGTGALADLSRPQVQGQKPASSTTVKPNKHRGKRDRT